MTRRGFFQLALGATLAPKLLPPSRELCATEMAMDAIPNVDEIHAMLSKVMRTRKSPPDVIEIITDDDGLRTMFSLVEADPSKVEEMVADVYRSEAVEFTPGG